MDKKMDIWTIIVGVFSIIGVIIAVFLAVNDSMNKKIEKLDASITRRIETAINDPNFIKKVAEEVRLPFLIFDKNGTYLSESGGASAYIEKIVPIFEDRRFSGFVVHPKKLLSEAPILQAINNEFQFTLPKRINTIDWKYRIPETIGGVSWDTGQYDEQPAVLFKLEVLR